MLQKEDIQANNQIANLYFDFIYYGDNITRNKIQRLTVYTDEKYTVNSILWVLMSAYETEHYL